MAPPPTVSPNRSCANQNRLYAMNPTKNCEPYETPPPFSPPASSVSENAALSSSAPGRSRYFIMKLSSVCSRRRWLLLYVSVPTYWFSTTEIEPEGRHRIWPPAPRSLLNRPYDCQPLISQGSILSLSDVKIWARMPLKNHGVFDDTYDGW